MVFLHPHHDSMACPATLNLTNDGVVVGEGEGGEVGGWWSHGRVLMNFSGESRTRRYLQCLIHGL